jgi:hypothetical protein
MFKRFSNFRAIVGIQASAPLSSKLSRNIECKTSLQCQSPKSRSPPSHYYPKTSSYSLSYLQFPSRHSFAFITSNHFLLPPSTLHQYLTIAPYCILASFRTPSLYWPKSSLQIYLLGLLQKQRKRRCHWYIKSHYFSSPRTNISN